MLSGNHAQCLEQAWTAYRAGSLPIGAVVVDRAGQIVGRGRNQIFEVDAETPVLALKDVRYAASDPAAGSLSLLEASELCRRSTSAESCSHPVGYAGSLVIQSARSSTFFWNWTLSFGAGQHRRRRHQRRRLR